MFGLSVITQFLAYQLSNTPFRLKYKEKKNSSMIIQNINKYQVISSYLMNSSTKGPSFNSNDSFYQGQFME